VTPTPVAPSGKEDERKLVDTPRPTRSSELGWYGPLPWSRSPSNEIGLELRAINFAMRMEREGARAPRGRPWAASDSRLVNCGDSGSPRDPIAPTLDQQVELHYAGQIDTIEVDETTCTSMTIATVVQDAVADLSAMACLTSSRGQSTLHGADLNYLDLLALDNEDMASVRWNRAHALADRIHGCRGRPVHVVAED
jgi:hypothetical protein